MVSAIVREGRTLYPPGAEPLKNIVTNYSSLTGSDKWLLSSLMLLIFRPLLVNTESMVRIANQALLGHVAVGHAWV